MSASVVGSRPASMRSAKDSPRSIVALARIEAARLMRHPILAAGLVCYAAFTATFRWFTYPDADYTGDVSSAGTFDWTVIGALLVGLFGFMAANRVARSTDRTAGLVDASPMSQSRRTLALCFACLAPFAVTVLGNAVILVMWLVHPPVLQPGWFEVATSEKVWVLATAALTGLGGPVLGVAVASWWRWPGALAVTGAALVVWCVTSAGVVSSLALRLLHVSGPYTTPEYSDETSAIIWQGGSLMWRFAYVVGLVVLAAIAAVAYGTVGLRRRRLQRLAVAVGTATLVAYVLAVFVGPAARLIAQ